MSLHEINAFRGNFLIAFAGAALIIFLIKVTPLLLPAKYYFSFSSLMGSDSEPFIVEPPGVTGQKLCALLEKYDIPKDRFARHIDCSLDYVKEPKTGSSGESAFLPQEKDKIYTVALQGDPQLRSDIGAALQSPEVALPTDDDVNAIVSQSGSVSRAFDKLFGSYKSSLDAVVDGAVGEKVKNVFAADLEASNRKAQSAGSGGQDDSEDVGGITHPLPDATRAKIIEAYRKASTRLSRAQLASALAPITKSEVDRAIAESYGWYGIDDSLVGYYKRALSDGYVHNVLRQEFKANGLDVKTPDEERRLIYAEINKFSWENYVIAILVRLAPVLVIGILLGLIFGQSEVLSIGVAGAMAAFLLSWPLMLMWDRLVQSSWQDKKTTFLLFYAAYIAAFFITARASALIGAKVRDSTAIGARLATAGSGSTAPKEISWLSIATNVVASVLANVAVYIGNVIIPLQALADNKPS
jgi:hypothetical protein